MGAVDIDVKDSNENSEPRAWFSHCLVIAAIATQPLSKDKSRDLCFARWVRTPLANNERKIFCRIFLFYPISNRECLLSPRICLIFSATVTTKLQLLPLLLLPSPLLLLLLWRNRLLPVPSLKRPSVVENLTVGKHFTNFISITHKSSNHHHTRKSFTHSPSMLIHQRFTLPYRSTFWAYAFDSSWYFSIFFLLLLFFNRHILRPIAFYSPTFPANCVLLTIVPVLYNEIPPRLLWPSPSYFFFFLKCGLSESQATQILV